MHPSRKRAGFTLIELLTVIAIIAILMSLLLPAMNAAKNAAKKSQAKSDLTQFVTAVKSFYTDYGTYPIDPGIEQTGQKDVEYGAPNGSYHNQEIVNVLRSDTLSTDTLSTSGSAPISVNTREVVYLDVPYVKDSTSPKSGLGTGKESNGITTKAGEWYDPFGEPYIVDIDGTYDGYVAPSPSVLCQYKDINYVQVPQSGGNTGGTQGVQTGVIAGSFGTDHTQGSAANPQHYAGSDDILSWE
jgi:prepilin-type N-terminal cleavage/methylation domain-containing protein